MKPLERIHRAISGGAADRVPVVPKIWIDLAARLTDARLLDLLRDPALALRAIAEAGLMCKVDGVRQFHFPQRRIEHRDGKAFEVDGKGRRLGEIDLLGGLQTRLDDPADYHLEDLHICGNVRPIAEDLVKTGLDCIGPLDPLGGSTPLEIRKRVGNSVALMGGVNTLSFVNSTADEIIEEARQCILHAGGEGDISSARAAWFPKPLRERTLKRSEPPVSATESIKTEDSRPRRTSHAE